MEPGFHFDFTHRVIKNTSVVKLQRKHTHAVRKPLLQACCMPNSSSFTQKCHLPIQCNSFLLMKFVMVNFLHSLEQQSVPGAQLSTSAPSTLPSLQSWLKLVIGRSGTLCWIQPSRRCLGVFDSAWIQKHIAVRKLLKIAFHLQPQKQVIFKKQTTSWTLPLHPRLPRLAWRWSSVGSESRPDPGSVSGSHLQWL